MVGGHWVPALGGTVLGLPWEKGYSMHPESAVCGSAWGHLLACLVKFLTMASAYILLLVYVLIRICYTKGFCFVFDISTPFTYFAGKEALRKM